MTAFSAVSGKKALPGGLTFFLLLPAVHFITVEMLVPRVGVRRSGTRRVYWFKSELYTHVLVVVAKLYSDCFGISSREAMYVRFPINARMCL